MSLLNANLARFFFESAALPPEVFEVASFTGYEEISRLYRFEFELISQDPYVDFSSVINQPATFTMMRGGTPVPIHGVVVELRQLGRTADHVTYRAVLAPRLWWLSLSHQSRIFQHQTVEDIITHILDEAGLSPADYQFELLESYQPREYCVQFQETDLAFVSRLMEHEGIWYYFQQEDDHEMLVITDDVSSALPIEDSTISYHESEGMVEEAHEVVQFFTCCEQVVTGKVLLKNYNYETPDVDLKVESMVNTEDPSVGVRYEYGEHYDDPSTGDRLARVRNEEIEANRRVFEGDGSCVGFRSGFLFTLESHYRSDFDEDYLLVSVRHEGSQRRAMGLSVLPGEPEDGPQILYRNAFSCRRAGGPYRPPRTTPVPRIPGVMIAKIERAAAPYADLDEDGRYRAKMDFDLADTSPMEATLPIRMNQPYSGPDYGIHFPNHQDTEMIWACVNGDIDRPLALGTAPNPNQASPSKSANEWQSVIRTWGKNELTFDDKQGEENIYMHATKDHTRVVTNNESISVGNDRTKSVGHDETNTIKNDRTTTIEEGDESLSVMQGDRIVLIDTGDNMMTVEGDCYRTVRNGDDMVVIENGDKRVYVNKDSLHTVDGDHLVVVKKDIDVQSTESQIHLTAATEIVLEVGQSKIAMYSDGTIEISGLNIAIEGTQSVNIHGASVTSKADVDHTTQGSIVLSDGAATNTVKGGMVMLNP